MRALPASRPEPGPPAAAGSPRYRKASSGRRSSCQAEGSPGPGAHAPGGRPGRRRVSCPARRASALSSVPALARLWRGAQLGTHGKRGWGCQSPWGGLGPPFPCSAAAPASRRACALLRALVAPKRGPASPQPRRPKLSFPFLPPFQTPSPILSGFVGGGGGGFPPHELGQPATEAAGSATVGSHLSATVLGIPAPRGSAAASDRATPAPTHSSASRPSPLRPPAPVALRNSPDFPLPFYLFLFGKTTKRVAARCLRPRAGAHCAGTERGAAPKETGPPPRPLPAPRRRSLGPIFGPRTTGFASAGQGVEPGASRGSPRHP